ncbi:hypothetical protein TRAPUB_5654 [Trametes pubescens]|uniref:Uncharacterized protein n=1 Tax=Trametes pubescens TaxID=154538 RepID=A0A1M2V7Y3_TRAPU|nr:hypothetical protein TRAPUB_5654 [Trametes pubescens]
MYTPTAFLDSDNTFGESNAAQELSNTAADSFEYSPLFAIATGNEFESGIPLLFGENERSLAEGTYTASVPSRTGPTLVKFSVPCVIM